MKRVLAILLMSVMFISVQSQNKSGKQKLSREEKKELKLQQKEEATRIIDSIVGLKQFVLEADQIKNRQGQTFPVSSTINFIMVDSVKAVFQFGSVNLIGINGIGGATVEGNITRFDIDRNEKSGSYYMRISITATIGFYDIVLNISSSGKASAQVTALSNNRIDYSGRIVPFTQSRVYKGWSR